MQVYALVSPVAAPAIAYRAAILFVTFFVFTDDARKAMVCCQFNYLARIL
jgi:hypothetical protein